MTRDSNGGVDLLGVIFITLIILRLFGIINISWWWVFSPPHHRGYPCSSLCPHL